MEKAKKLLVAVFVVLTINFTIAPNLAAHADHCYDALEECTEMCGDAWVDAAVEHPFFAVAGLVALGACGDGCAIGYAACLIFL